MKSIAQVLCLKNLDKLQGEYSRRQEDLRGHKEHETLKECLICEQLRWECKVIALRHSQMSEQANESRR